MMKKCRSVIAFIGTFTTNNFLWDSIQITNPFHVSFGLKGNSVGTAASVPKFGYIERKSVAFIDIFSSEV